MTKYRGGIFDLDGVLVDTAEFHFKAWKRLAEKLGVAFDLQDNHQLKGVSRKRSLEIILEKGGLDFPDSEKEQLTALKNNWYLEYINQISPDHILPGALQVLDHLDTLKVKTALASASRNARSVISKLGLDTRFEVIVDGNEVSSSKPDPEVFIKCASGLALSPGQCVVFEDANAGIVGARKAGMYTVALGTHDFPQAHMIKASLAQVDESMMDNLFK